MPASLALASAGTAAIGLLAGGGPADPRLAALPQLLVVLAASAGLSGQEPALDRAAAIRWAPRRALHVVLAGLLAAATLPVLQALGGQPITAGFAARNAAGLAGLAALGAAAAGGTYAWTPPFGWFTVAFFTPPVNAPVLTWMLLPPGDHAAAWTAGALAAGGLLYYAAAGPRR
ncbi:hypothetical protein Sru01_67110 [Sphaerisporangium rufum]|uniref:Uncharacterized protein n=1 Tax=Sphaerisporangium rufum TaxID=1381558 RepID=A0A919R8V6_9ACTN|nr:hypothetical protein [Sphaerisporangium rufum]GII81729.1 hypothetical protein Sru01_67110 [Sphaerisporangium rufum]